MKKIVCSVCAVFFVISLGCSKTVIKTVNPDSYGSVTVREMIYYNFPTVRAERPDKTPRNIIIKVTAGYYDNKPLADELIQKDDALKTIIVDFGASIDAGHFSDSSLYNDAHKQLRDMLNAKLEKGKIDTIIFKKLEAQQ